MLRMHERISIPLEYQVVPESGVKQERHNDDDHSSEHDH